ncbi:hypothetical protein QR680_011070 [Steinernema hermaphroditum]|uniref:Hypoxanthine phosphoribosyltransferase n=1 Tax=Steinernema hermaphroditum TaxID=289476 RepID=A0AA39ISH9_9BILA|nr:hypothetical protein QR680_011070 [Steinernema hermaphroditum]
MFVFRLCGFILEVQLLLISEYGCGEGAAVYQCLNTSLSVRGLCKEGSTMSVDSCCSKANKAANMTKSTSISIPDSLEMPTNSFVVPGCYRDDLKSVIIPEGLIRDRVKRLAQEIHDVIGDEPLVVLCILKGSYRFFTTLVDDLTVARHACASPLVIDFIRAKSYEDTESTGTLQIMGLSSLDELKGQNILIVEDIVDSGLTMSRLLKTIYGNGAKKCWTSILLSKRVPRTVEVPEDFVAFDIPDKFIVGYGLDYNQKFRDLNHICVMSESGIEKYKNS